MCCEDCYNEYKNNLKLKVINPNYKNNLNLNDLCVKLNQNDNFELCEMFKCFDCSRVDKISESDIVICPLTLRSDKGNKISIINNNNEKYSDNPINKSFQLNAKSNQQKPAIGFQNVIITAQPENISKNINLSALHKNNHSNLNNLYVDANKNNGNNLNTSVNKMKSIKEVRSGKILEDINKKETKKKKVTCMSMCLLY